MATVLQTADFYPLTILPNILVPSVGVEPTFVSLRGSSIAALLRRHFVGLVGIEPTMWGFTDPVSPKNQSQISEDDRTRTCLLIRPLLLVKVVNPSSVPIQSALSVQPHSHLCTRWESNPRSSA